MLYVLVSLWLVLLSLLALLLLVVVVVISLVVVVVVVALVVVLSLWLVIFIAPVARAEGRVDGEALRRGAGDDDVEDVDADGKD